MTTPDPASNGSLASCASSCVAAGLCALPALRRGDEKRVALSSWKAYQSRLPSAGELGAWFASEDAGARPSDSGLSMCLVCGAVSGHLEMIDFDNWDGGGGEAFEAWRDAVEAAAPGLLERLVVETTPSGGRHAVYRCETPVSGNTKLAQRRIVVGSGVDAGEPVVIGRKEYVPRRDGDGGWVVTVTIIETRGEGGLFLCAPSEGYQNTPRATCATRPCSPPTSAICCSAARGRSTKPPPRSSEMAVSRFRPCRTAAERPVPATTSTIGVMRVAC